MLKNSIAMQTSWRYAWVFVLLMGLSGCSAYTTEYQFVPPVDPVGKSCVASCQQTGRQCRTLCTPENPACDCEADFRACYQLCGGDVVEKRVW